MATFFFPWHDPLRSKAKTQRKQCHNPPRVQRTWQIAGTDLRTVAPTKSEARAKFKKQLDCLIRLPAGMKLKEVTTP